MGKKNLILCFSSLRPSQYDEKFLEDREKNYLLSLDWLLRAIPENWDIVYNDNTINSISDLKNHDLINLLNSKRINLFLHGDNEGSVNKGAGEHDMCKKSFSTINPDEYNWVSYFTARHIIPNSWYFDKLETEWNEHESVMSNPGFYYLSNYKYAESANGLYNDMLFSMKSNIFTKFINSIDVDLLKRMGKNSETHLFEFISSSVEKNLVIDNLGILRNDHQSYGWHLV
jgi:hypothetical protein